MSVVMMILGGRQNKSVTFSKEVFYGEKEYLRPLKT
jgi:hypothetical protein